MILLLTNRASIFASSIGCAVARLYAARYTKIEGLLLLDPMIAHTDFVSLFESRPSEDITLEEEQQLEKSRAVFGKIFHPNLPNAEGFDRSQLCNEVPSATEPSLLGQPFVTVSFNGKRFLSDT